MAITNGSTILKADLDAMVSTSLGLVQADNAQLPIAMPVNFFFDGLTASSNARYCRRVFVCPCDLMLETVAVRTGEFTAASTTSVAVTGDGALVNWPTTVSGTTGAGTTKLDRLLYSGASKTNVKRNFSTTATAVRTFNRGSTITVTASTTSVAAIGMCQVTLVFREFFLRA